MKNNINIKDQKAIAAMRHGGKILADVLFAVMTKVKPGIAEIEIDKMAEKMIRERGGEPGFMRVPGYHHTICAATNEIVVHGIPRPYTFKAGDIVCIDCGVFYDGYHTDMAETVLVQSAEDKTQNDPEKVRFLDIGKKALEEAITVAVVGNRIGHISQIIQHIVEDEGGYSIVRSLVGHGVGRELHEPPEVPGYVQQPLNRSPHLEEGMTIAIEIIYTMGKADVTYAGTDDWTIKSKDNSLSAVFERTVLISKNGPEVLTKS